MDCSSLIDLLHPIIQDIQQLKCDCTCAHEPILKFAKKVPGLHEIYNGIPDDGLKNLVCNTCYANGSVVFSIRFVSRFRRDVHLYSD